MQKQRDSRYRTSTSLAARNQSNSTPADLGSQGNAARVEQRGLGGSKRLIPDNNVRPRLLTLFGDRPPVMENPSYIVPVRVSSPLQGGNRQPAQPLRGLRAAHQWPDGAARHGAHALHANAGSFRCADLRSHRRAQGALGCLPGRQGPVYKARCRVDFAPATEGDA